jgi:hypothetical protein
MGLQAWIVDRPAHGEVVEHLKTVSSESEDPVCEVVEEAPMPVLRMPRASASR